jgi:hypothetical protein
VSTAIHRFYETDGGTVYLKLIKHQRRYANADVKYQLVLQWPASSIKDYDAMIRIEDTLIEKLSGEHKVDGHDAGSGEMNIFIHTDNPNNAFKEIKAVLGSRDFWVDARVAYREVTGDEYTILWPKDLTQFTVT